MLGLAASAKGVVAIARHDVRINASGNLASPSTDALAALSTVLILGLFQRAHLAGRTGAQIPALGR